MNETERAERLLGALERSAADEAPTPEDAALLDFARMLSRVDYSAESRIRVDLRHRLLHRRMPVKRVVRALSGIAAMLALVIGLVLAVPPLRTWAQEIVDSLFNRAPADTQVLEYEVVPTPINTIAPSVAQTFDSIAAAEAAGIDIRQPGIDLSPYQLSGVTVNHETQSIWLTYNAPGRYLSIYQRPAALGWLSERLVGASAEIVTVDFGGENGILGGEFVQGGWLPTTDPTPEGGDTVSQSADWTTETSQRYLRWQDANFVYEMTAMGGSSDTAATWLSLDDLIAIAKSMS